jgi:hypothetical protein
MCGYLSDNLTMITKESQINNWKRFEQVRASGEYNMFDPKARALTGLNKEDYVFVMKNYSELEKAYEYQMEENFLKAEISNVF